MKLVIQLKDSRLFLRDVYCCPLAPEAITNILNCVGCVYFEGSYKTKITLASKIGGEKIPLNLYRTREEIAYLVSPEIEFPETTDLHFYDYMTANPEAIECSYEKRE